MEAEAVKALSTKENRMKLHANARLSLKGRELLVHRVKVEGWSLMEAAEAAGISEPTARKWLTRYRAEGPAGLLDRSSAPETGGIFKID